MNGIDPKWVFYLGVLVTIEQGIGQGSVKLTNVVPDTWAPFIVGWCTMLAFIGNIIMTAMAAYSSKSAGPLVKPLVLVTVIFGSMVGFAGDARAQQPRRTGNIVQDIKTAVTEQTTKPANGDTGLNLLKALDTKLLPDLQYALLLAKASNSSITSNCWQAWVDVIQVRQTAVKDAQGNEVPLPEPHLVTTFEQLVELRNMLQPDSKFMTACSPVANMVKMDVAKFMGIVITGGAGLASLGFGV